ncbi:MAG: hypothetical protein FWH48_02575 [Oscillospiraceae bacterium]|nr:hypothetical protein [Oscillospiraceae bacterium]
MKTTIIQPHKSSLGMDANIASLIIFAAIIVISWIPVLKWFAWGVPLVFFFLEKGSDFVKFQAATAFVIGIVNSVLAFVFQIFIWILTPKDAVAALNLVLGRGWGLWALLGTIAMIVNVIITLITVYVTMMAYSYKQVELPFLGKAAKKVSEILGNTNIKL